MLIFENKDRLIIALDVDTKQKALELVKKLGDFADMFKVGMQLFYAEGPEILYSIKNAGHKIFLDLKLHDIPATVAKACRVLTRYEVDIINVHASGGLSMMQAAASAVQDEAAICNIKPPIVVAVTVLTSMSQGDLNCQLSIQGAVEEHVVRLAKLAQQAGLHGVVAAPSEIEIIRKECGDVFTIITPGIRPENTDKNDQVRVMTPKQALDLGASYIVAGRPVVSADDPVKAAEAILKEISDVKGKMKKC
ncbi:orotidine-5'-phosphate decarboxylase [Peptococcaceae bacterium]|nr:orotidine-5'-phosphate decarboxylase [Peptococcaceae bacterium]